MMHTHQGICMQRNASLLQKVARQLKMTSGTGQAAAKQALLFCQSSLQGLKPG